MFQVPNDCRFKLKNHSLNSSDADGNNGAFIIIFEGRELQCIASDGEGWDHVSVSLSNRCPNWREMSYIKNLFWDEEDTVIQFHPPKSEYINNLPYCLHLWRPQDIKIPLPPSILVGIKESERKE